MTDPIIQETHKAQGMFFSIKNLIEEFEELKKAIDKQDNFEIGRVMFRIEKLLNYLYIGFGGEAKK
jgi:hypothetical protein